MVFTFLLGRSAMDTLRGLLRQSPLAFPKFRRRARRCDQGARSRPGAQLGAVDVDATLLPIFG